MVRPSAWSLFSSFSLLFIQITDKAQSAVCWLVTLSDRGTPFQSANRFRTKHSMSLREARAQAWPSSADEANLHGPQGAGARPSELERPHKPD